MTRYTVVWSTDAENYLAKVWVDYPDQRQAITAAANAIDRQLATDPAATGVPLKEGLRVWDVPPLHVLFEILEQDRIARVVKARLNDSTSSRHERNGEGNPLTGPPTGGLGNEENPSGL